MRRFWLGVCAASLLQIAAVGCHGVQSCADGSCGLGPSNFGPTPGPASTSVMPGSPG